MERVVGRRRGCSGCAPRLVRDPRATGTRRAGLRDLIAFTLGYAAQAGAYLFLLTPRYPTSDPELAEPYSELPEHPVRMVVTDDLERPRLTVLFRLFLAIPHIVWFVLWSIAVVLRRVRRPGCSR